MTKKVLIFFWLILLMLTRFVNLERNLKFNRDESSDLVKMHQYWVEKKISLVGPISEDQSLVYSSLSYYLVMPAAVIFGFTAVSPTIGTAFWSVVTGGLMAWWLLKKKSSVLDWMLILIWYPLVITGRWAWNPNLVSLSMIVGWLLVNSKNKLAQFWGGLVMGLTSHFHYLGFIPAAILGFFKQNIKRLDKMFFYICGLLIPPAIFILFDLTHKPGLFITRLFLFKGKMMGLNLSAFRICGQYLWGGGGWFWVGLILVLMLLGWEIKNKKYQKWYCWLAIILLAGSVSFVKDPQEHYLIGAVIPFWIWVTEKREKIGNYLRILLLGGLILSSCQKSMDLIFGKMPDDSAYSAQRITELVVADIIKNKLTNPNLAVLQSSDINSYGLKFRDLLLIKGIRLKEPGEISISDNLYVVTQAENEETVRKDASDQMQKFKKGPAVLIGEVKDNWKVYRFNLY
jgi:hypothetical protein